MRLFFISELPENVRKLGKFSFPGLENFDISAKVVLIRTKNGPKSSFLVNSTELLRNALGPNGVLRTALGSSSSTLDVVFFFKFS